MRRGRRWVGVVATALVVLSGTGAQAGPSQGRDDARLPCARHPRWPRYDDVPARCTCCRAAGAGHPLRAGGGLRGPYRGSTTSVTVLGTGGVPASGVGAVAVHVTVTGATGSGYVTAYPGGGTAPTASTLNVTAGRRT